MAQIIHKHLTSEPHRGGGGLSRLFHLLALGSRDPGPRWRPLAEPQHSSHLRGLTGPLPPLRLNSKAPLLLLKSIFIDLSPQSSHKRRQRR